VKSANQCKELNFIFGKKSRQKQYTIESFDTINLFHTKFLFSFQKETQQIKKRNNQKFSVNSTFENLKSIQTKSFNQKLSNINSVI